MYFRHQDHDTKPKNISKLENRILEKGSLLRECCVNKCTYTYVPFLLIIHKTYSNMKPLLSVPYTKDQSKKRDRTL